MSQLGHLVDEHEHSPEVHAELGGLGDVANPELFEQRGALLGQLQHPRSAEARTSGCVVAISV